MDGLRVPESLSDITPCWLTGALSAAGESGGPSVLGYSAEALAEGKGFMNRLYRLRVEFDSAPTDLPLTVIAKLPTTDPLLGTVVEGLGQNRREVRFYRELASSPHMPTPRVYHSGMDPASGNTALLLEDLSWARQGDSVAGCTLDEAGRCIGQLARFHASWWDNPLLEEQDWMPLREADASAYEQIYPGAWSALQEKAGDAMPPGLRVLGDRLLQQVGWIKARLTHPPRTVVHGDYRLDNCFFAAGTDAHRVIVIDWEFCTKGRGAYDVATFISEAFSPLDRRAVEMGLLKEYHSVLEAHGATGYSFQDCLQDYQLSMLEVFVFWIVTGGYCDYEGERATAYLRSTLERLEAAIVDLASFELIAEKSDQ